MFTYHTWINLLCTVTCDHDRLVQHTLLLLLQAGGNYHVA